MALSRENKIYLKKVSKQDRFIDSISGFLTEGYYDIDNFITPDEIEEYSRFLRNWFKEPPKPKDSSYRYMITFTLKEVPKNEEKIEQYIIKQLKRKPLQIEEAYLVKEYGGKNNRVHWHAAVQCTKYLAKDRFAYYEKIYGFIDIKKNYSQTLKYAIQYISKDNKPLKIIG